MTDQESELSGSGWRNDNIGGLNRLRRETTSPFGMSRRESYDPRLGLKIIDDHSSSARREIFQWSDPVSKDRGLGRLRHIKKNTNRNQMGFLDVGQQIQKRVEVLKDHRVQVSLRCETNSEVDLGLSGFDDINSVVIIIYGSNGIDYCIMQAEPGLEMDESRVWQQRLPELLNYIRTTDKDEFPMIQQVAEDNLNKSISKYASGTNEYILAVVSIAQKQLIDTLLQALPEEDRQEAKELLEVCGLDIDLTEAALFEIHTKGPGSIERPLNSKSEQEIISMAIEQMINVLMSHPGAHQQVLELKGFNDTGFEYQEVEVNNAGQKAAGGSLEERKIKVQGDGDYDKDIRVQSNTLVISKKGDTLSAACSSWKKPLWRATFPLIIPIDQIINCGNNPDLDFRQVEDLLNAATVQFFP